MLPYATDHDMERGTSRGILYKSKTSETAPGILTPIFAIKTQPFSVAWNQVAIFEAFFTNRRLLPLDPSSQTDR